MAVAVDPKIGEIEKVARERGVEFYFAQFVDMYARPSAKLVPAANLDELVKDALRHRLVLTYQALAEEVSPDTILDAVIAKVPTPHIQLGRNAA